MRVRKLLFFILPVSVCLLCMAFPVGVNASEEIRPFSVREIVSVTECENFAEKFFSKWKAGDLESLHDISTPQVSDRFLFSESDAFYIRDVVMEHLDPQAVLDENACRQIDAEILVALKSRLQSYQIGEVRILNESSFQIIGTGIMLPPLQSLREITLKEPLQDVIQDVYRQEDARLVEAYVSGGTEALEGVAANVLYPVLFHKAVQSYLLMAPEQKQIRCTVNVRNHRFSVVNIEFI